MKTLFALVFLLLSMMIAGCGSSPSGSPEQKKEPAPSPSNEPTAQPVPPLKYVDFDIPLSTIPLSLKARYKENGNVEILHYPDGYTLPLEVAKVPGLASGGVGVSPYDPAAPERCADYRKNAMAISELSDKSNLENNPNYFSLRLIHSVVVKLRTPGMDGTSTLFKMAIADASKGIPYSNHGMVIENPLVFDRVETAIRTKPSAMVNLVGKEDVLLRWFLGLYSNPTASQSPFVSGELFGRDLLCDIKEGNAYVEMTFTGYETNMTNGSKKYHTFTLVFNSLAIPTN